MITIYLSSTFEDLKEYRLVTFTALRKSGYEVINMEDYAASNKRPLDECLRDIEKRTSIYVGIFAFRYGYIPPVEHLKNCEYTKQHDEWQGLSITELEFRYAKKIGKPCLVFLLKEGSPWNPSFIDAYVEREKGNPGQRMDRLRRDLLQEQVANVFSSPQELAIQVQAALSKQLQASGDLKAQTISPQPKITWDIKTEGSPYPGLMHFTRRYSPVFFGRDPEVHEILHRLYNKRCSFILVSGDSGVGKSSVIDAGVLPRLEENGLPDGQSCLCLRMVPSYGHGYNPFDALMGALHTPAEQAGLNPYAIGKEMQRTPDKIGVRIKEIISKGTRSSILLLFLDQMEELFTIQAREYSDKFLTAIFAAIQEGIVWVVATIRSDQLHYCHRHPDLIQVLRGPGHYPLGSVDSITMADMIRKPAQCAGLEINDQLVHRIVRETGYETGSLPLLAFMLQRLFEYRQGNTLSEPVYISIGGVSGAVSEHIKSVEQDLCQYENVDLEDQLSKLFQAIIVVNADGPPTRRRALLADFDSDLKLLVENLVQARLLTIEGQGENSTVSVAHERLITAWQSLARWIAENQDDLRILAQAEIESREWEKNDYDLKYLWHIDRLKKLKKIIQRFDNPSISDRVRRYVSPQNELFNILKTWELSRTNFMEIYNYLFELGDNRSNLGLRADGLPDIVWCEVPSGTIILDDNADVFLVAPFFIAKYPVTWIQYWVFLETDTGYQNKHWWVELEAHTTDPPFDRNNIQDGYPAENISWCDAMAYCSWLSEQLGYEIQLPTEWEWQQAATVGDPANKYPWGQDWDPNKANTSESNFGRTTAVGLYPKGASPVGALDMAGNVSEWCLNEYNYPRRQLWKSTEKRVLRGGSWRLNQNYALATFRDYHDPLFRKLGQGFRLRCTSPISRTNVK
jgi:hypothetical protein